MNRLPINVHEDSKPPGLTEMMKPLKSARLARGTKVAPFRRDQQLIKKNKKIKLFAVQTEMLERVKKMKIDKDTLRQTKMW